MFTELPFLLGFGVDDRTYVRYYSGMSYQQLTPTHERASELVPEPGLDQLHALLGDGSGPDWEPGTDIDLGTEFPELEDWSEGVPGVPAGLDDMAPGPALAAFLSSIEVADLKGFDQVTVLRAHQRMASHYQALLYTAMAAVTTTFEDTDPEPDVGYHTAAEDAAVEIGTALTLTRRAADSEVGFALSLQRRLPQVHDMLETGAIDTRRAKCIDTATAHLTTGAARNVVERIAEAAPELTTGQLRARIKKLCIETDPDDAQQRHDRAVTDRRFIMEPTLEGTCNLIGLDLPVVDATRAANRINTIAKSLRRKGETRTMDQLRSDVFLDLLTGRHTHPTTGRGTVHVTVDLDTLTALTEHPGELAGYGPIISDIARQIAEQSPDAEWRWTVTDTDTGEPASNGITSRRPTAQMRRNIQTRDRYCVFPGCRMPSTESDLDHRKAIAHGGKTSERNLAPLCRFHHILKHHGWTTDKLPNGRYQWTSPLGHTYTTRRAPP
jgi:Domain of unknown function (DUF222)